MYPLSLPNRGFAAFTDGQECSYRDPPGSSDQGVNLSSIVVRKKDGECMNGKQKLWIGSQYTLRLDESAAGTAVRASLRLARARGHALVDGRLGLRVRIAGRFPAPGLAREGRTQRPERGGRRRKPAGSRQRYAAHTSRMTRSALRPSIRSTRSEECSRARSMSASFRNCPGP